MTEKQVEPKNANQELLQLNLQVPEDLYRAFHRCTWIIVNETGRSQLSVMEEMVRDFLVKHGC